MAAIKKLDLDFSECVDHGNNDVHAHIVGHGGSNNLRVPPGKIRQNVLDKFKGQQIRYTYDIFLKEKNGKHTLVFVLEEIE